MHDLLQAHGRIVQSYHVLAHQVDGRNRRLRLVITFTDGSTLHVRDYRLGSSTRKYAFHWQDADAQLLMRWDNAPHWPDVETHPHHRHVGQADHVEPSDETELGDVLAVVARHLADE